MSLTWRGSEQRRNARVLRTDLEGAVLLESDGEEVQSRTMAAAGQVLTLGPEPLIESP